MFIKNQHFSFWFFSFLVFQPSTVCFPAVNKICLHLITQQTHPCNENRVFPLKFFSQGKTCFHYREPCFHYRDGFAVFFFCCCCFLFSFCFCPQLSRFDEYSLWFTNLFRNFAKIQHHVCTVQISVQIVKQYLINSL